MFEKKLSNRVTSGVNSHKLGVIEIKTGRIRLIKCRRDRRSGRASTIKVGEHAKVGPVDNTNVLAQAV